MEVVLILAVCERLLGLFLCKETDLGTELGVGLVVFFKCERERHVLVQ
jgi:hypothetical protein